VKVILAGGGKGGYRPAVKTAPQCYDCMPAGAVFHKRIFPGKLTGPLVGLGPRIGKEDLFHPGARAGLYEFFGEGRGCVA